MGWGLELSLLLSQRELILTTLSSSVLTANLCRYQAEVSTAESRGLMVSMHVRLFTAGLLPTMQAGAD
jgi:hypothetical protein